MPDDQYITASCVISNHVVYKNETPVFGNKDVNLPGFLLSAYEHFEFKYPKFYKMDNLSKLGWLAAEVLLKQGFHTSHYHPDDIGVVLANSSSSLDTDIKYFQTTQTIASPALFVYTLPNIMIGEICIRHNFKGENGFFIFEQFNAGFLQHYVNNLFNNNTLQACICGWVELLDDEYKAVLFLVEKGTDTQTARFSLENINKIYQLENG
ncbi:MAG: hypothetical protein ABI415_00135 [Flavitalea sp.]